MVTILLTWSYDVSKLLHAIQTLICKILGSASILTLWSVTYLLLIERGDEIDLIYWLKFLFVRRRRSRGMCTINERAEAECRILVSKSGYFSSFDTGKIVRIKLCINGSLYDDLPISCVSACDASPIVYLHNPRLYDLPVRVLLLRASLI